MEPTQLKSGDVADTKQIFDWEALLQQCRTTAKENEDNSEKSVDFFNEIQTYFPPKLIDVLQEYNNALMIDPNDNNNKLLTKEEKKRLVLDSRAALRVALMCSSLEDSEVRDSTTKKLVMEFECHYQLCRLLSSHRGDAKCRTLASQLMSNLVTMQDYEAANYIASNLALAPSEESVMERIRQGISSETSASPNDDCTSDSSQKEMNWVDMLLASAHAENREAVSGIVAALHNLVVSLQSSDFDMGLHFANKVSSNSMLVSTLLRQIISLQSLRQAFEHDKKKEEFRREASDMSSKEACLGDSATEWISLLIVKCCKLGMLPNLMSSAGGTGNSQSSPTSADTITATIVPEHIVLLQCIHSEVETSVLDKSSDQRKENLLGGDIGRKGVVSTHAFLAKLYTSIRRSVPVDCIASPGTTDSDIVLQCSALETILEILASSLGVDNTEISQVRTELGTTDYSIIQDAAKELGTLVDTLTARNQGCSSRNFFMTDGEQRVITVLVRFLGNVCHNCRQNQDLVRLTKIPLPIQMIPSDSSAEPALEERNALHVLLSCTSVAHSCFTLREWAVVAVRNLLDQNELNQAEVAKLEANQPVQTASLNELGIRVDMDSKGKVSVIPEDKQVQ